MTVAGSPTASARRADRDAGMGLVQLIVPMAVMAVLAVALLSMVTAFLRSDGAASDRIDEARDLQQIYLYLPADVSSVPVTELAKDSTTGDDYVDATAPSVPARCPGSSTTGVNVLDLSWHETFAGSTKQYRVQYRRDTVGSESQMVRVACRGAATLGETSVQVVARALDPAQPVLVQVNGAVVEMTVHQASGQASTITASSKNPDDSLEYTSEFDD